MTARGWGWKDSRISYPGECNNRVSRPGAARLSGGKKAAHEGAFATAYARYARAAWSLRSSARKRRLRRWIYM